MLCTAAAEAAPEHKNLLVLDKNISKDELKKTMEGFAAQLGVKCVFCHTGEEPQLTIGMICWLGTAPV